MTNEMKRYPCLSTLNGDPCCMFCGRSWDEVVRLLRKFKRWDKMPDCPARAAAPVCPNCDGDGYDELTTCGDRHMCRNCNGTGKLMPYHGNNQSPPAAPARADEPTPANPVEVFRSLLDEKHNDKLRYRMDYLRQEFNSLFPKKVGE